MASLVALRDAVLAEVSERLAPSGFRRFGGVGGNELRRKLRDRIEIIHLP